MSFRFEPTEIPAVVEVTPTLHADARGFFSERYRRSAFVGAGIDAVFVQDNVARSGPGVLRGLHFQARPSAQGKLVGAVRGSIWDVAVDLRRDAPTFGRWVARTLDADRGNLLWIPEGFAHGYCVLGEGADVAYKVTAEYDPEREGGVRWDDPAVGIEWPLAEPVVSEKDRALPGLDGVGSPFGG